MNLRNELLDGRLLREANSRGCAARQPERADKQINRISEEGGLISLNRVADELKYPADNKQPQRPSPIEEEQRHRHDDHRDADTVGQPVQRMLMLGFVAGNEVSSHALVVFGLWSLVLGLGSLGRLLVSPKA